MAKDDKVMQYKVDQNIKQKPEPKMNYSIRELTKTVTTPNKKQPPKDVQSESSKMQQAEEEKQRKVDLEYENYMKGDKTRLKDQGGSMFAKGGSVKSASSRADGIAIRGKTRA